MPLSITLFFSAVSCVIFLFLEALLVGSVTTMFSLWQEERTKNPMITPRCMILVDGHSGELLSLQFTDEEDED